MGQLAAHYNKLFFILLVFQEQARPWHLEPSCSSLINLKYVQKMNHCLLSGVDGGLLHAKLCTYLFLAQIGSDFVVYVAFQASSAAMSLQ